MIPFDGKTGDGAEQVGLGAVMAKMLDRLIDQHRRLGAGALLAH